jgi:hypothetical protein
MAKQSSNALSRLASRIMTGAEATRQDIKTLAASVLSQDETKGARKTRKAKTRKAKTRKAKSSTSAAKKRKSKSKTKSAATKRAAKKRK